MPKLNRDIIRSNIEEAREELQKIEATLARDEPIDPVWFQVSMQHAFHHLIRAVDMRVRDLRILPRLALLMPAGVIHGRHLAQWTRHVVVIGSGRLHPLRALRQSGSS